MNKNKVDLDKTRKQIGSTNSSELLDQNYADNLQKQIHFMSLELDVLWVNKPWLIEACQGVFLALRNDGRERSERDQPSDQDQREDVPTWAKRVAEEGRVARKAIVSKAEECLVIETAGLDLEEQPIDLRVDWSDRLNGVEISLKKKFRYS